MDDGVAGNGGAIAMFKGILKGAKMDFFFGGIIGMIMGMICMICIKRNDGAAGRARHGKSCYSCRHSVVRDSQMGAYLHCRKSGCECMEEFPCGMFEREPEW